MSGVRQEAESVALRGARWFTMAFVFVGILNYGYALLLTRMLDVREYSIFAAAQGIILWTAALAAVSLPWVLAQSVARARAGDEQNAAIWFCMLVSAMAGATGAVVAAAIGAQFAGALSTLALALSVLVIFLGTTTKGWLQGHERMGTLSALTVAEALVRIAAGLLLATAAGLADAGALLGFGVGGLVLLVFLPPRRRVAGRAWLAPLSQRELWRPALGIAGVQGFVTLFAAVDVVLVTLLPADPSMAASYQVSATLSRVPLYVAGAVSTAFFPSLSRRVPGAALAAQAVRMYLMIALPVAAVLITMPASVLSEVFPDQYGAVGGLLRFTAITGVSVGGMNMVTTFYQAVNDYSCLWLQGVGLVGYVAAMLAGWKAAGMTGLAVGAAIGATLTLSLLIYRFARQQGNLPFSRIPLLGPLAAASVLFMLRSHAILWVVAATVVGMVASKRFLHRGDSRKNHARCGSGPTTRKIMRNVEPSAVSVLADAVWRGRTETRTRDGLQQTLALARVNHVEGRLARAYPEQLDDVAARVNLANRLFMSNLCEVARRLRQAGIPAVLIKADLPGDYVYSNFDLVVPNSQWDGVFRTLAGWYVHRSEHWLERSTKTLLYPETGPALHLHSEVAWFDVPVIPADELITRARPGDFGCLVPGPADQLRIWLAHALFQNLSLDLSELLALRKLLHGEVIEASHKEAGREGWRAGFEGALAAAQSAIDRLDRGTMLDLPVPLPMRVSLRIAAEHARHLQRTSQSRLAMREMVLRAPLIAAKTRRTRIS